MQFEFINTILWKPTKLI